MDAALGGFLGRFCGHAGCFAGGGRLWWLRFYSAINPHYAAFGALVGILGATALGLIAPTFGGTDRLISAPCAPAAAVLSAFAIQLVSQGVPAVSIVLMMTVLGILTGLIQMLIGFLGVGKLIKHSLSSGQRLPVVSD